MDPRQPQAIALREQGAKLEEIAVALECSVPHASKLCREIRPRGARLEVVLSQPMLDSLSQMFQETHAVRESQGNFTNFVAELLESAIADFRLTHRSKPELAPDPAAVLVAVATNRTSENGSNGHGGSRPAVRLEDRRVRVCAEMRRRALILSREQGLNAAVIARRLDVSAKTVRTILREADPENETEV